MAKILQFPNGKIPKAARKPVPQHVDRSADFERQSSDVAMDVIRYFQDSPVSFETLEFLHDAMSMIYRERRKRERER